MKKELHINRLVRIFEDAFNGNLDFASMDTCEFLEFANEFMNGKTEYFKDDYFLKNYDQTVSMLLNRITNN